MPANDQVDKNLMSHRNTDVGVDGSRVLVIDDAKIDTESSGRVSARCFRWLWNAERRTQNAAEHRTQNSKKTP